MRIFIPTRGRVDEQITREKWHLDDVQFPVTYVVPECEKHLWGGEDIQVVPDHFRIAEIRQAILEQATRSDPYIAVLDDDLTLSRRTGNGASVLKCTIDDARQGFNRWLGFLKNGYVFGGISSSSFNNLKPDSELEECERTNCCVFMDGWELKRQGITYLPGALPLLTDVHFQISVIKLGFKTFCDYQYCFGSRKNSTGGCFRFRTPEMIEQCERRLLELHPGCFTTSVCKKTGKLRLSAQYKRSLGRNSKDRL